MLTKIFNSGSIGSITIFIILVLVLWAKIFVSAVPVYGSFVASPLYDFVFRHIGDLKIIDALITLIPFCAI